MLYNDLARKGHMKKDILSVCNVVKTFKQADETLEVLNGITYEFQRGRTYAITGASGSGKSTLVHIMSGMDDPTEGSVSYNGYLLGHFSVRKKEELLNKHIGLVFQQPYLIRELTVIENVMLKKMISAPATKSDHEKAHELLSYIGLDAKSNSTPRSLSGGQQQQVAIVRAIFNKPAFLLADEPTGNVDRKTGKRIVSLLRSCQKEWGMGVVVSTHDMYVARAMECQLHLEGGKLHC